MKRIILLAGLSMMAAFASGSGSGEPGVADRTQDIVLDCSQGMGKCVLAANKICGGRGFDEIDRLQDVRVTTTGRMEDQGDGRSIYRDEVSFENQRQTMVIRCR